MNRKWPRLVLIVLLAGFWCALLAGIFFSWNVGPLGKEAEEYLTIAEQVNGGFDIRFALQKVCFLVGVVVLVVGTVMTLRSSRAGSALLMLGGMPLAFTLPLGNPESYFPLLVSLKAQWFVALAAAFWGAASAVAWASTQPEREGGSRAA